MNRQISQSITLLYNLSQFVGWTAVLFGVILNVLKGNYTVLQDPFVFKATALVQTAQFLDVLFSMLGISKTNLGPSILHLTGRNLVVWLAFPALHSVYPSLAIIPWAISDMIRFGNYLNIALGLGLNWIKVLRYNAFIILYPIGLTGEFLSAGDAKTLLENEKRNYNLSIFGTALPVDVISCLKVFRIIAYPGLAFLYIHLLKLRSKFYRAEKEKKQKAT